MLTLSHRIKDPMNVASNCRLYFVKKTLYLTTAFFGQLKRQHKREIMMVLIIDAIAMAIIPLFDGKA